jgi:hypothetical protein
VNNLNPDRLGPLRGAALPAAPSGPACNLLSRALRLGLAGVQAGVSLWERGDPTAARRRAAGCAADDVSAVRASGRGAPGAVGTLWEPLRDTAPWGAVSRRVASDLMACPSVQPAAARLRAGNAPPAAASWAPPGAPGARRHRAGRVLPRPPRPAARPPGPPGQREGGFKTTVPRGGARPPAARPVRGGRGTRGARRKPAHVTARA